MKHENMNNDVKPDVERERDEWRERYSLLVDAVNEAVFIMSEEAIVECNTQASLLLGYDKQQIVGRKPWAFSPEYQKDGVSTEIHAEEFVSRASGTTFHVNEWLLEKKDGTLLDTEVTISAITIGGEKYMQGVILDVSEYRETEDILKERNSQYQAIFESIFEMVMIYDADGNILDINEATTKGLGYTKKELLKLKAVDFIHPDSLSQYHRFVQEISDGNSHVGEATCYRKDGSLMEIEVSGSPFVYQGEPAMLAVGRDVTARNIAERALKASEKRLSLALEAVNDGIWDWNIPSGKTYFSPQYYQIVGYEADEFPANFDEWAKRVHPDDYDGAYSDIKSHLNGENSFFQTEFRFRAKTGAWIWIRARGKTIEWDSDGNAVRMIGTHIDVTDKKIAEKALKESEERFRTIINQSADMFFMCDKETGDIIDVNRYACMKTGYNREELLTMNITEVEAEYSAETLIHEYWMKMKEGERFTLSGKHRRKDGECYPVEIRMSVISIGGKAYVIGLARDVTDRVRARRALEESNTMLRLVLDTIPVGVFWKDIEGRYLGCNSLFARKAECESPDDIIGKTDNDMIWKDKAGYFMSWDKRVAETGEALLNFVVDDVELSGEKRTISESKVPLKNYEGKIIGILGAYQDITEEVDARKRNEQAKAELIRRNRLMEGLLSAIPHPVFYKDRQGRYLGCNKAFTDLTGKSQKELVNNRIIDVWSTDESNENHEIDLDIMKNQKTVIYEISLWDKDGEYHDGIMSKSIFRDENGDVAGLVGMFSDISELKRTQNKLNQSQVMLDSIITSVPDIIYRLDENGNITFVSSRIRDYGFTPESLIKTNIFHLLHPDDAEEIKEMFNNRKSGELRSISYEARMRLMKSEPKKKDKWPVFYITSESLFEPDENGGEIFVGTQCIARDISEHKLLQDQLAQSQKMESIGRLAGGVAHDFNNLLTVIAGNAQIALMNMSKDNELHEYLAEIEQTTSRAADLTRQLLAFSRKQIIEPKVLDINATINEMEKMFGRLIGETIDFSLALSEDLWPVRIDPGQVQQIVTNLVVNARDAMPDGGRLTIETQNVTLSEEYTRYHSDMLHGDYVMFAVDDTGVGMDEGTKKHVFEPFFTTKEKGKGTGLGLSTCYGIVKQNSGYILVYSEKGHGTTIRVYLPRTDEQPHTGKPVNATLVLPGGTETVLVVEDEPGVRKMTVSILRRYGYVVHDASNGEVALKKIEDTGVMPDLLITDVIMPRMGGQKLSEKMTELFGDMKVLFMSGYTDESIVHHGVLNPGIEFIEKPFAPDVLLKKIRQILDS